MIIFKALIFPSPLSFNLDSDVIQLKAILVFALSAIELVQVIYFPMKGYIQAHMILLSPLSLYCSHSISISISETISTIDESQINARIFSKLGFITAKTRSKELVRFSSLPSPTYSQ